MTPPEYDDAAARASARAPFANGFEWDHWSDGNCYRCVHEETCPLILVAMLGKTPAEWEPGKPGHLGEQYRCACFQQAGQ